MWQLRAAAKRFVVDRREVILETDARADGADSGEDALEHLVVLVDVRVVADQKRPAIEVQAARQRPPAYNTNGVRAVAVLGPRLGQVRRARLDVEQRRVRCEIERRIVEATAAFERILAPRDFEGAECLLKRRHQRGRQRFKIVVLHTVAGRIVERAHEPAVGGNVDPATAHALSHIGAVGHVGEHAGVRPAATSPARAAVVRGLVRVVQAGGAVAKKHDDRREIAHQSEVREYGRDPVNRLVEGEADRLAAVHDARAVIHAERREPCGRERRQARHQPLAPLERGARRRDTDQGFESR